MGNNRDAQAEAVVMDLNMMLDDVLDKLVPEKDDLREALRSFGLIILQESIKIQKNHLRHMLEER